MRDYAKFFWPQRDCNPQMNKLRVISYTSSWPGECGRFCRDKVVLFCCFSYGWMSHLVCLAPDVEGIKTIVKICENADFSFLYKEALKRCTNYSQKRLKSPSSTKLILSGRFYTTRKQTSSCCWRQQENYKEYHEIEYKMTRRTVYYI